MHPMRKRLTLTSASIVAGLLLATATAGASAATTTVNLTAQRMSTTLPDGSIVPMWGYCTNDKTGTSAAQANPALGGGQLLAANVCSAVPAGTTTAVANTVWAPGPTIVVPTGNQLTINLANNITAGTATSLVILGQIGGSAGAPTRDAAALAHQPVTTTTWPANAAAGTPFTPPSQAIRARAFAQEAAFGGGVSYTWNTAIGTEPNPDGGTNTIYLKPGTYLYETGSHPSLQAPMGLYGVLVVTDAPLVEPRYALTAGTSVGTVHLNTAGRAFPGAYAQFASQAGLRNVPYDMDATILLSEIDAVQNAAVDAAAVAGTSETLRWNDPNCLSSQKAAPAGAQVPCYPAAVNYAPTYFLVNGKPFDPTNPSATALALPDYLGSDTGAITGNVLVRWVNAGSRVHVPSIVGLPMQLIGEDGNVAPGNPRIQAEVNMPAGKTIDAIVRPKSSSTGNTDTNGYADAVYAFFDRELSTSTGNITKGGFEGYIAITPGSTATSSGTAHTTALNGAIGKSNAGALAIKANPDNYTLSPNATTYTNNVLANDVGVTGSVISGATPVSGTTTATLTYGSVVLNTNGSFTYTVGATTAPTTFPTADTFTYCGNNGTACALVTLAFEAKGAAPIVVARQYDNTPTTAFPSNVASLIMVPGSSGVLVGATDPGNFPMTAALDPASAAPAWVKLNADGSFTATPCATSLPATCSFSFIAVNSQGTASAPATATIVFPVGSGLPVNLVDAQSGNALVADYGWVIEEDQTWHNATPGVTPGYTAGSAPPPSLATSFHRSHMPIVAAGCTGPLSCRDAQTYNGTPAAQQARSLPSDVALDPTKFYYISFLPGDAANPFIAGNGLSPLDPANSACLKPSAAGLNDARCGHTMGGAQINPPAAGSNSYAPLTVKVEPNPLKPARLSIYIFEDNAPTNGDPDSLEHGLGGFEIVVWDVGGHSGDPVGQVTYDAFNMPLTNALLGTPGCPNTASPTPSAAAAGTPNFAGKDLTGVVFTCPNDPVDPSNPSPEYALQGMALINNLMPGRYDVIAHPGAAREGKGEHWLQVSTLEGTPGQDAFTKSGEPPFFQEYGPPGFHTFIGFLNPDHILVQNQVAINPGATLSTTDGGEPQETFPASCGGTSNCATLQTTSITGRITSLHMSRPVMETLFDSGARGQLSETTCYVSLNQTGETGLNIGFTTCDAQGNFTLTSIPVGNYMLAIWDQWLDQIIAFKAVQVVAGTTPDANGNPVPAGPIAMGDIPVFSWFTRIESNVAINQDSAGNPIAPAPLAQIPVRVRFRSGAISNTLLTDANGNAIFNELFPLFNWYVVESDRARWIGSNVNVTVDAGGLPDCATYTASTGQTAITTTGNAASGVPCATTAGILNSSYVWTDPITGKSYGGVPAGASTSTNRVDSGDIKYEGLQGFVNQTEILSWGKRPYAANENGGIEGMVVYASTRGFDDPGLEVQFMWEPGVPRVKVNLYRETPNADGTTGLLLVNSTTTTSWDDFTDGKTALGTPVCPGQDANDPFLTYTLGASNQFKCYDGFHLWNQVQPAVYDGAYSIETAYAHGMTAAGVPLVAGETPTALTPGKYVVEMVLPQGYEVVKEEDKNILIGDAWVAPLASQFGGGALATLFIQPDQASVVAAYNANNPGNNNTTMRLGFQGAKTPFPACVGAMHTVPDFMSLFPNSGQVAPFAGAQKPLCDRKEVALNSGMTAVANFFVFSDTPRAASFTGLILDDLATEINAASPDFGEKFAVAYAPVSLKDMNGVEIGRVYSDQWGTYNGVVFSSWQVNVPNPAGYSPNMLVTCMNDPGPILDTRPGSPTYGTMITDPLFNPSFSNFCYTNPFMPGNTVYLDTPVIPIAAFADGYSPPDCSYQDLTPAIARVDGDTIGPWVLASGPRQITIKALGQVDVQNPIYQGPAASTAPWNQRTITRTYSFGSTPGTVSILNGGKAIALTNVTWTDGLITATLPANAVSGELVITRGDNGLSSTDAITVNVEATAPSAIVEPALGSASGTTYGFSHPIQDAIDAAKPGDLVIIDAGSYSEMVVMWKPVRLQGVGANAVTIVASKYPTQKLEEWRPRINKLFGLDVTSFTGNQQADAGGVTPDITPNPQVDPLPTQLPITGGITLLEPTILATEEGAGITVLAKGVGPDGATPLTAQDCTALGGGVFAASPGSSYFQVTATNNSVASQATITPTGWNMADSNFLCAPSRIDGLSITGSDAGGGIYVNGWAHGLEISNNRIYSNSSAMHGGMRIGSPFEEETPPGPLGYGYDDNVNIHHNWISKNGTSEATPGIANTINMTGAGAGISVCTGSDNFAVNYNFICGNFSNGNGGGIGVLGNSVNGVIAHNQVLFNQSAQQTAPVHGGGIAVEGDLTTAGSINGVSNGTGNILIDSNLILGNYAQDGHGGGIVLAQVNGNDVVTNPTNPSAWYVATVSNNIIVNNVAGWSGGGIYMVDTFNAQIVNNTIANNDSIASVGSLYGLNGRGPVTAYPSPAGISTDLTATALVAALPVAGAGIPANATKAWNAYANPVLFNDIIWHNRSFFIDGSSGTTNVCSSNQVSDAGGTLGTLNCTVLPAQTWAGQCTGTPAYWDLGAVGDASAAASNAGFGNLVGTITSAGADPGFVQGYCNGSRANPALKFEPGQPFLPPFALNAGVTLDEAGNFVDVKFGPLSLTDPLQPGAVYYGNYNILNTGAAFNAGAVQDTLNVPVANAPAADYAGAPRPDPARIAPAGYDAGALQYSVTAAGAARASVNVIPAALSFNVANGSAVVTKSVTVINTSTAVVSFAAAGISFTVSDPTITQTNTCGASIASGAGCTVSVSFAPVAGVTTAATATLNFAFVAAPGVPASLNVPVTAAVGNVVLSAPAAFAAQTVGTTSAAQYATLTNSGAVPVAIQATTIAGTDFSLPGGGTCAGVVPAAIAPATSASCTIAVAFAPTPTGTYAGTLNVTLAGGTVLSAPLSGTAVVTSYAVAPTALAFGNVAVGVASTAQTVTVTNNSTLPVPVSAFSITGSNAADFAFAPVAPCTSASTIAPAASCSFSVTLTPVAAGARAATLIGPVAGASVALSGVGIAPSIALSPASPVSFTTGVGMTSAAQDITVTNTSALPNMPLSGLTVAALAGLNPDQFTILPYSAVAPVTSTCLAGSTVVLASAATTPATVAGSCTISVQFTPSAAISQKHATLTVSASNAPSGTASAATALVGTAQVATYTATPSPLSFGVQGEGLTSTLVLTVTNTSPVATLFLASANLGISGTNAADYAILPASTCGTAPVLAGASCTISVGFTPTGTGTRTASLNLTPTASAAAQAIALNGTGVAATYTLTPAPVAFGQVQAGNSASQVITLTNTSAIPANLSGITVALSGANVADYSQANTCAGSTVLTGASCQITVSFAPARPNTQSQARNAVLTVTAAGGAATTTDALSGTATQALATLVVANGAFGNEQINTTSANVATITYTNNGIGTLAVGSINLGANAAANGYAVTSNTCTGASLAAAPTLGGAGGACALTVSFTPSTTGNKNTAITVTDTTAGVVNTGLPAQLTGAAVAPRATLSIGNVAFGQQQVSTTSAPTTVTYTNNGIGALTVTSLALGANAGQYVVGSNTCANATLAPAATLGGTGGSCAMSLSFAPTSIGNKNTTVTVTDTTLGVVNTPASGQIAITATGVVPNPALSNQANLQNFVSNPAGVSTAFRTVTLSNANPYAEAFTITNFTVSTASGPEQFLPLTGSTCAIGNVVAPGATCTFQVALERTAGQPAGTTTGALTVTVAAQGSTTPTYTVTRNLRGL